MNDYLVIDSGGDVCMYRINMNYGRLIVTLTSLDCIMHERSIIVITFLCDFHFLSVSLILLCISSQLVFHLIFPEFVSK